MTDVILQWLLTSVSARFPRALKTAFFLFHNTSLAFNLAIGEVCSNFRGVELFVCVCAI